MLPPNAADGSATESQTTETRATAPHDPTVVDAPTELHAPPPSAQPNREPAASPAAPLHTRAPAASSAPTKVQEIELKGVDPSQLYEGDAYVLGVRGGGSALSGSSPTPLPRPQVSQQAAAAHLDVAPLPDPKSLAELIAMRGRPRPALVLEFCIDREGRPRDIVRRGRQKPGPWLAIYADALTRWRFTPFEVRGRPVPVCTSWAFDPESQSSR